jgi:non-specific serine/threonine protein kinase
VRFTLLETIRAYALARLVEQGEEASARDAHAAWFLGLAEACRGAWSSSEQTTWLHRIDADRDNLRSAFAWLLQQGSAELAGRLAVALTVYWVPRDAFVEGQAALRAVRECGELSPALLVNTLDCEATFAHYMGDYAATERLAQALLTHGIQHGDTRSEALGHAFMSKVIGARGASAVAVAHAEQALAYFQLVPDPLDLPLAMNRLALELSELGEYARAHALYEEVLDLWRTQGDATGAMMALANFGALLWRMGQPERALAMLQESLGLAWERQVLASCAEAVAGIAAIAADLGWHTWGAGLLGAIDALCVQTGFTLYSWSREAYQHGTEHGRSSLGDTAFHAAWRHGQDVELAQVVAAARAFELAVPPSPLPAIAQKVAPGVIGAVELTPREREILDLLCARQTNAEIADHLFLSRRTVESHVRNVLGKLGAENRREAAVAFEERVEFGCALALRLEPRFSCAFCEQCVHERRRKPLGHRAKRRSSALRSHIDRQPHAEPKLRVVFEERVGPSRAASLLVLGVGRGRQVTAVNRRAARGVGHQQVVPKKLREQPQVRRLSAARARPGELEQRQPQRRGALVDWKCRQGR